jgi:multidrug efflux pump subunit AcrA (membrane-fusion protein)
MPKDSHSSHSGQGSPGGSSGLLSRDPPPRIIQRAAWLIVALFVVGITAAFVVRIPETIRCPSVLVPESGADPIQSPRRAVVQELRVAEGSIVASGDELFVLKSEEVGDIDMQARSMEEDIRSHEFSLKQADEVNSAELLIKDQEVAQMEDELKFRLSSVNVQKDLVARYDKMNKVGIYTEADLILRKLELEQSEKDLSVAGRTREQVILQRQQMAAEYAKQHSDQLSEIAKLKIQLEGLKAQLEDSHRGLVSVRAPYDGVVVSLAASNPGSVVQNGQELCQLARADGKLRVRIVVAEQGLARLSVGQRVRFFADAFPYQRYGAVTGKLLWISPSAVSSASGHQFIAQASLDRTTLRVGEEARPLRVGMKGEVRITVGSRTLVESLFEPIRELRESMGR